MNISEVNEERKKRMISGYAIWFTFVYTVIFVRDLIDSLFNYFRNLLKAPKSRDVIR